MSFGLWKVPDCSICCSPLTNDLCTLNTCGHVFHNQCARKWFESKRVKCPCPLCRTTWTLRAQRSLSFQVEPIPLRIGTLDQISPENVIHMLRNFLEMGKASMNHYNTEITQLKTELHETQKRRTEIQVLYQETLSALEKSKKDYEELSLSVDRLKKQNESLITKSQQSKNELSLVKYLKEPSNDEEFKALLKRFEVTTDHKFFLTVLHNRLREESSVSESKEITKERWKQNALELKAANDHLVSRCQLHEAALATVRQELTDLKVQLKRQSRTKHRNKDPPLIFPPSHVKKNYSSSFLPSSREPEQTLPDMNQDVSNRQICVDSLNEPCNNITTATPHVIGNLCATPGNTLSQDQETCVVKETSITNSREEFLSNVPYFPSEIPNCVSSLIPTGSRSHNAENSLHRPAIQSINEQKGMLQNSTPAGHRSILFQNDRFTDAASHQTSNSCQTPCHKTLMRTSVSSCLGPTDSVTWESLGLPSTPVCASYETSCSSATSHANSETLPLATRLREKRKSQGETPISNDLAIHLRTCIGIKSPSNVEKNLTQPHLQSRMFILNKVQGCLTRRVVKTFTVP